MIDEYVRAIEEAIAALGKLVLNSTVYNEEREANFIILRGEVKFAEGSQLHFREFVQLKEGQAPNRYKYAYHFQRADETIIFRYVTPGITCICPLRRIINTLGKLKSLRRTLPIYSPS